MKIRFFSSAYITVAATICLMLASGVNAQNALSKASTVQTPRAPNGKPDLNGMWNGGGGGGGGGVTENDGNINSPIASRRCAPNQVGCNDQTNQTIDQEYTGRVDPSRPLYKPEYWDKVQDLDRNTNTKDPLFQCQPYGVPRMGPPTKIVQTANEVIFIYAAGGAATQPAAYRIIPTDGRKHDPVRALDVTYYGDGVGHWEDDTLVIDLVGFNDVTWLARGGYFHSDLMHVIEKFTRSGDTLTYQVIVEDPEVLLQPWVMTPRTLKLNTDPNAFIPEGDPCREYDQSNMSSRIRH